MSVTALISFLLLLLVIVCVGLVGWWIIGKMAIPAPANWIAQLVLGALLLLALFYTAAGVLPGLN
jgi:hypothetical protein